MPSRFHPVGIEAEIVQYLPWVGIGLDTDQIAQHRVPRRVLPQIKAVFIHVDGLHQEIDALILPIQNHLTEAGIRHPGPHYFRREIHAHIVSHQRLIQERAMESPLLTILHSQKAQPPGG